MREGKILRDFLSTEKGKALQRTINNIILHDLFLSCYIQLIHLIINLH